LGVDFKKSLRGPYCCVCCNFASPPYLQYWW